jgi:hypothetical protein
VGLVNDLRDSIREEVAHVINQVINTIGETNIKPNVENVTDKMDFQADIKSDLLLSVIGDGAWTVGALALGLTAIAVGAVGLSVPLLLYGVLTALSWLVGGIDDNIGVVTTKYSHEDLLGYGPGESIPTDPSVQEEEDGENKWTLSHRLTVNSIGVSF